MKFVAQRWEDRLKRARRYYRREMAGKALPPDEVVWWLADFAEGELNRRARKTQPSTDHAGGINE